MCNRIAYQHPRSKPRPTGTITLNSTGFGTRCTLTFPISGRAG
jgi:hypothetical protein